MKIKLRGIVVVFAMLPASAFGQEIHAGDVSSVAQTAFTGDSSAEVVGDLALETVGDLSPQLQLAPLDLPPVAAMAENITSRGLLETEVALGDMFRIGSVVVQVSQPRSPCHKLAARYGRRSLPVEMQTTGYTGFLLRVLTEGEMRAGDDIVALGHPGGDRVSVADAGQIANVNRRDLDGARRLLALDVLGSATRRTLEARVASGGHDGDDTDRLFLDD